MRSIPLGSALAQPGPGRSLAGIAHVEIEFGARQAWIKATEWPWQNRQTSKPTQSGVLPGQGDACGGAREASVMLRPVAPSAAPELHDSARWVGAGRGAHVMAYNCLRYNVRLKSTLVQPLLEVGLLLKHVEALVEWACDLDCRAAQ